MGLFKKIKKLSLGCKVQTHISQTLYANAFELFIYDTRKNMLAGCNKWLANNNYKNDKMDVNADYAGLVFENEKMPIIVNTEGDDYKVFAAMFLNEQDLTMNILAHESTHAAMVLERNVIRYVGLYDGDDGTGASSEERLAYTIGEFVENILHACIKYKIKLKYVEEEKKK